MKPLALLVVVLLSVSVAGCQPLPAGKSTTPLTPIVDTTHEPEMAATPELDSLALFASGLFGAAGYALTLSRTRRRSFMTPPRAPAENLISSYGP
jgi:hypothetical protein